MSSGDAKKACAILVLCLASCRGSDEPIEQPAAMPGPSPFEYPTELWDRKLEGETLLMVHVTELGAVDSVYVQEPSGQPAFDSAALRGARQLRFSPGKQGQRRIPMWTRLPVRFSRDTLPAVGLPEPGRLP